MEWCLQLGDHILRVTGKQDVLGGGATRLMRDQAVMPGETGGRAEVISLEKRRLTS